MEVKVYDEKVRALQSHLPFLERFIREKDKKARPNLTGTLDKLKQIHKLVESTKTGLRPSITVIEKMEKTIRELKTRCETKQNDTPESVPVKKEVTDVSDKASVCESVSETPDSPSPTRNYDRKSPIEIPTERSDDREHKIKREKDSHRYDDNRRYKQDNQRSERPVEKYNKYNHPDRNRSRYEQHERSKSRDRHRFDRRERSDSSERGRHAPIDRNRNRYEDRDSRDRDRESRDRDNTRKKYDHRTDRVIKTERSDRNSPATQRNSGNIGKSQDNDFHTTAFARLGARPTYTAAKSYDDDDDERFTEDEVAELTARNKNLFGCDSVDEKSASLKNLTEVRSKLANQIKLAEITRNKDKPSATVTRSEIPAPDMSKISLNAQAKRTGSRFELSSLRECTPPNSVAMDKPSKFSFLKTFNQSNATVEPTTDEMRIDDDIINKIVAQPIKANNKQFQPIIPDMNLIKKALETANNQQRLALKYNPKARARPNLNVPETTNQSHHQPEAPQSNNLELVCYNDPRLPPRVRDPRYQAQDSFHQAFSPPSTPPCISNYPAIIQSSSGYKQNSYPTQNPFSAQPGHQNAYPNTISLQHHLQSQSNLISITPHMSAFNNSRGIHHQASPVSSSDVSPPPGFQHQPPSFPEHNRNSIHNKFRPSLNDNVERKKYEQSRNRRNSVYYGNETPREIHKTYGEYKRSLQSTVSSSSEKSEKANNQSRAAIISTSHHDKVYRSGNYSTPIPSVATKLPGSKFKIPKKTTNETAKPIPTTENVESKDSEDEQSNARVVKDSDDSETDVSGNSKTIMSSDNETSDIRDPRMRAQALRRSSQSVENVTKDSEKQNNVVTSSTCIMPEKVSTPDNMEFLKHLTNPNNLLALINLVGQMSDDNTFTKVKEVLEKAKETSANVSNEDTVEHLSTSTEREKIGVPKTPRKKSKNELEKLNEDIRTMFISDGVLNATGRRVCALYNNNAADGKESTGAKNAKPKKQTKDDVAIQNKSAPENRITRRRNTMVCYTEPSIRSLKPVTDSTKEHQLKPTTPEAAKSATETTKSATQEPKIAKKKAIEPVDDADEPPTKRVTRAQLKECNIVLEKISDDASVESLTNSVNPKKDGKGKRQRNAALKSGVKKAKTGAMKNINPELHSLKKLMRCLICDKPTGQSFVNHYVNFHPDTEVVNSRLPPDVADNLRNSKVTCVAERKQLEGRSYVVYFHPCHFCNVTKGLTKTFWMNHMAKHTGYYQYKCNDCSRTFAEKNKSHACKDRNNLSKIPQPQFQESTLKGFLCDLCNFFRFYQNEMEKHLRCEHELTVTDKFKEITLLDFPKRHKKSQIEDDDDDEEEDDDDEEEEELEVEEENAEGDRENVKSDDESKTSTPKRRKLMPKTENTDKESSDYSSEKVLRSRVVHTEAFISEPKQDDGLFDKDTMKLMKDMSFSASKDGECTARSNRAKSIAEKLSERFNSVQEDDTSKPNAEREAKIEPLDPLTCDEGIQIIRVTSNEDCLTEETANEDCQTEETNVEVPEAMEISNVIEKTSPSSVAGSIRDNNCTPTDEYIDESDENWESYSSDDDSVDDADAVDDSVVVVQRQPNRKNVGITDTIARLQQSISSQGNSSNVEGVEKLPDTTSREDAKDEMNSETISVVSDPVDPTITQSATAEKSTDSENPSEEEKRVPVTYETIVSETMQLETKVVDGTENVKKCVSNGRSPNSNHSFSFRGTSVSQLGSRNGNFGGSSSNADSTNLDVDMVDVNKPAKTLIRIDNIGYTRSADSNVSFCCLIDECGFESPDLSNLLYHIDEHPVEWFGYCFSCNAQIENDPVQLMMEFKHMTTAHYNKKEDSDSNDTSNVPGKSTLIKCKLLPGDKLSKMKEEEITAKAQQLNINPKPSTSASVKGAPKFLKIENEKSFPMITSVVSLGSATREYKESEIVSLKEWLSNPTNKLQKYCKQMLRDICLYALYKCMDVHCSFTTDNAENMLIHLRNHDNENGHPSWLECAYCDIVADSCTLLVKHIQEEHQSSIFQCPYCFYRTCAAFNVVVHLKQYHPSEKKSVLVCNGKPRLYATEKALIEKSRGENIRALRCTEGCKKITYVMDHFVKHMKNSPDHGEKFKCQFCGFNTLVSETAKHLLVHSVGVYECVYCHYGINDVESIQSHMCNTHPSKLLYICVRLTRKDRELSDEQLSSVESTLIFHLGQTVDNKLFQRCPFTDEQLSIKSPAIASSANITKTIASPNPLPSIRNLSAPSSGINIASVTSISNELFANAAETIITANTGLMLSDVLSYKDLEKDYMADDWDKHFATLSTAVTPTAKPKRKPSVTQARVELPENKKASTSTASRTDLLQDEIDNAAYILVKGTGLEGRDLYRCSFPNCDEKCNDIFIFNVHLLNHNPSANGFKCFHCTVVSKNIVGLKYHIKVHGIHRYFCYFCNYTSAIVNDIQKHMQDTHSKTLVNTIPLNPKKIDQNKDMFVVCPRGLRQDDLNRFSIKLIEKNKRQLTSTKKFYSPDDMEALPRQAIFHSSISCEICHYSTKVRTNMYRHLAAHKNEQSVPKNDPVNPVPCLDTGEKHFDKMINLACSSNDGKTPTVHYDSTAFIPEARRFVCNARNCQYQNISDNMLKRHLNTLHPNEEQYKCPHCNSLICQKMDADKIIFHLRMHDAKIYKCPKCMFSHHVKSLVEKHRDELHPGVLDPAMLITRDETTSASTSDGQPKVWKWKCNLCNDLCPTFKLIQAHIQTAHSIKFQYQCEICPEVQSNNKANIQEHIGQKHKNQESGIKVYYTKIECPENDNTPIWRRDDPNKIKHIRGILFEEENFRKSTATKKDQTEVKKKTSQKKRSDKPVVEQNSDIGEVPVIDESETKSIEDSESNAVVIISDDDVDKTSTVPKSPISHPTPSTSKNLFESGKSLMGSSKTPIKPSQTVVRAEATSSGIKNNKKESCLDKAYLCGRCLKFSANTVPLVRAHQATAHPNVVSEVLMLNTNNEAQQNKSTTKPLPDATTVTSKPKFSECINFGCHYCIFKSKFPSVVYRHWKENHKFPKITTKNIEIPGRPFCFNISKIFKCIYCRRCSDYKDLKVHGQRNHPLETFAMIDNFNPKKCALCIHEFSNTYTDVIEHFKESHNHPTADTSIDLENYMTDELVEEIASLLPREQVKCTQPNCKIIFFSMAELESHNSEKHAGSQMQFESIPNDPIMYCCVRCPEMNSNESSMVAHIRDHFLEFQCKICEKRYDKLEMIRAHHEIMHNIKDVTYRNIDINEYFNKYAAMKIIFPNGFFVTKADVKRTRYGSMDNIRKLLNELNVRDLEVVQKRQAENEQKELEVERKRREEKEKMEAEVERKRQEEISEKNTKPVTIKKINLKRSRITDSDSEDSLSQPLAKRVLRKKRKPETKPAVSKLKIESTSNSDDNEPLQNLISVPSNGRKSLRSSSVKPEPSSSNPKSNAKPEPNSSKSSSSASKSIKPKVELNISTSDDQEPLQNLIPFSCYGRKPKPVDLSKIFIDMPFGTASVKVSCDRFALLFNINPKLRLKRCDK